MANTSKLFEAIKEIDVNLNKIVDNTDSNDTLVALTYILNICEAIANNTSFTTSYRVNDDTTKCDINIINPASKIPSDDDTEEVGGDADPIKLDSDEAKTLDAMMDRISDRINSVDCEVEAIKDHLTELGLGLDATCDNSIEDDDDGYECKDIATIYCRLEHMDDQIINLFASDDNLEVDVNEHSERLDKISSIIESLNDRLNKIEIFNAQLCATLVQDKRFRKNFDRNAKKIRKSIKAIKRVDNSINTDKLVSDKEIKPSEE